MKQISNNNSRWQNLALAAAVVATLLAAVPAAQAAVIIRNDDVILTSGSEVASGNGQLDLILFGFSSGGGVAENAENGFDGDDANTMMPTGGATAFVGSYMTSMGELRDFYRLNFPDPVHPGQALVDNIVLFLDLSETGQTNHVTLTDLKIVIDYDLFAGSDSRNNPGGVDIATATQNSTGGTVNGGTIVSQFNPASLPKALPLNVQGAGWGDLYILTGVNPFDAAYSDNTRVQFVWGSSDHDNGGDKVFLSGSFTGIPEPGTMALLAIGTTALLRRRRTA